MKTINEFEVGMQVKQYDKDDGCWAYGHVIEVKETSVVIKWDDLNYPSEHLSGEFKTLSLNLNK